MIRGCLPVRAWGTRAIRPRWSWEAWLSWSHTLLEGLSAAVSPSRRFILPGALLIEEARRGCRQGVSENVPREFAVDEGRESRKDAQGSGAENPVSLPVLEPPLGGGASPGLRHAQTRTYTCVRMCSVGSALEGYEMRRDGDQTCCWRRARLLGGGLGLRGRSSEHRGVSPGR